MSRGGLYDEDLPKGTRNAKTGWEVGKSSGGSGSGSGGGGGSKGCAVVLLTAGGLVAAVVEMVRVVTS